MYVTVLFSLGALVVTCVGSWGKPHTSWESRRRVGVGERWRAGGQGCRKAQPEALQALAEVMQKTGEGAVVPETHATEAWSTYIFIARPVSDTGRHSSCRNRHTVCALRAAFKYMMASVLTNKSGQNCPRFSGQGWSQRSEAPRWVIPDLPASVGLGVGRGKETDHLKHFLKAYLLLISVEKNSKSAENSIISPTRMSFSPNFSGSLSILEIAFLQERCSQQQIWK